MTSFIITDLIQDLKRITNEGMQFLQENVSKLSENQKNWKPNELNWSILEVSAHLNSYANYYHKTIQSKIAKTKFIAKRTTFISSPLGKSTWTAIKLGNAQNIKRKFKAPKAYNPMLEKALVNGKDVEELIKNNSEFLILLDESAKVSLRKIRIPLAVARLVRLRLGDILMFLAYHNERHIQQIKNLIVHPNFPKA